jgi:hypothetical protein
LLEDSPDRHGYVAIGWKPGPLQVPRLAAIEDGLQVEMLPAMPMNLEAVLDAVGRAAEQMAQ